MHWIDPDCLPETVGRVDRFLLNPQGEADGLMLADGTEVHVPPHMGPDMLKALRPGSMVKLRAVRPRGADMVAAVAFESEDGIRYVDQGPPKDHKEHKEARRKDAHPNPMEIVGVVSRTLHGPKGEARGVLLEDGRIGRFPPHAADGLRPLLKAGASVVMRGDGVVTGHGTVVAVREIGATAEALGRIEPKPHKPPHDKHGHDKGGHDKGGHEKGGHAKHEGPKPPKKPQPQY